MGADLYSGVRRLVKATNDGIPEAGQCTISGQTQKRRGGQNIDKNRKANLDIQRPRLIRDWNSNFVEIGGTCL
jgi:hypothetical protein